MLTFFYLETEMEEWNWSRDKVSFPKNLFSMCSDTYMSWAFLHWCKLLFHPLFLSFPIGGDAVQLVCLLRALTVEKIFFVIFKGIVVWILALQKHVCLVLNWEITDSQSGLKTVESRPCTCLCVDELQSRYDNIVWRLHSGDSVPPLLPSAVEQSVHYVMCRAAAVIMAIMSSCSQIGSFFMVRTKEPDREGEC